ncbi:hypothetical protein J2125_001544 [Erwinia toletana]|uniref:Uncharacterized protein n=1 Tax=Winslowiella toletana TaxID=92490 RepID=A0ABS4P863_9GAMM|nr:phage regulatory CII family protein [Winslowiella toletana]MBP2168352.1 hypothetical protein [Winslowiella toletana]
MTDHVLPLTGALPVYVMKTMAEVGQLAASAVSTERMTPSRKSAFSVNRAVVKNIFDDGNVEQRAQQGVIRIPFG